MLKLKKLKKDYIIGNYAVHALKGIILNFRETEFVSVLGPSGCGKTTLMNLIGGLDHATAGDLEIKGISTKDYTDQDWDTYRNQTIGFVFQNYNLIPHLNVFGNVEIALTLSGMSVAERKERVLEVLEEVGLSDQVNKRPNQLSGGQSQRVAIARALVNRPNILLADEPTGALDTETSEQILKLIKKVSINKLVIMVTHNPDLANRYSTRVINMLDGQILNDSNPFAMEEDESQSQEVKPSKSIKAKQNNEMKHTSMPFVTALNLSFKNLLTKRGRTILTSIAGSIGIIGIALILALSGGMNHYISQLQTDLLASNPITISTNAVNFTQAFNAMNDSPMLQEFPEVQKVFVEEAIDFSSLITKNNLTDDYINYLYDNIDENLYSDIAIYTGLNLNIYSIKPGDSYYSPIVFESDMPSGPPTGSPMMSSGVGQQLLHTDLINSQYDILAGTYPENRNEIVIVVSDTNEIPESTLIGLGFVSVGDDTSEISFDDVLNTTFKVVPNNLLYEQVGNSYVAKSPLDIDFDQSVNIEIVGILRIKETADSGVLSTGIAYTKDLYDFMQTENYHSEIVEFMNTNPTLSPFTGIAYQPALTSTVDELRDTDLRALGGSLMANEINIYPVDLASKDMIKTVLDDYNVGKDDVDIITYTDLSELLGETLSSVVNIISYVLIAFTAISLIVSSIMIAIITYVSVLERTKEIGVLRSVGARKKDVTRIFNAETFIIGFTAGLLGIIIAYLISLPINLIVNSLVGVKNIASLSGVYAIILILISIVLTVISGLIPARKAAKLDPVLALRSE